MSEEVRMDQPKPAQTRRRRQRIIEPQAGPSTSQSLHSPVKKRKPTTLSVGEKGIILNVYKNIKNTWPENEYRSNLAMIKKTSEFTGISTRSIYGMLREYKDTHTFTPKGTTKSKISILQKLDSFDKTAIRQKVHRFFMEGELPTIDKIHQRINEDDMLPNFSKTTLRRVLHQLKFKFKKTYRNSALIERPEIILWRTKYLKEMEGYRNENRNIYYLDETWVNAGHTVTKAWTDTTVTSSRQALVEGLSTGAKTPTGKGKRLIVVHIGNENGFLEDCRWVFECKKTTDYHESMDAVHFEEWFGKVLTKLQRNDVVVMDNASYHSRRLEKTPTSSWKKQNIMDWLHAKQIPFEPENTKVHLLLKVKQVKNVYQKYVIDEMAKEKGVTVLRLPPYHCELNPIELIWADTKGYVARHNTTFKFADVKNLFNDALNQITTEKWKNCVEHVKKEEVKMKGLDNQIDKTVDRFIINVTDSSESDSYASENSDMDSLSELSE